jgi:uncharacterized membrane protein
VGHRLLFRQDRAQRDECRIDGAVPVSFCLSGHAAGSVDAPSAPISKRNPPAPHLGVLWRSRSIPDSVSRPRLDDGEPRIIDGRFDAGAVGRLDSLGWGALVASTVGAVLIVLGGHRGHVTQGGPSLEGDLLVVLSLCTALAWILLSKKLMLTHSPPLVSAYTVLSGTLMLIIYSLGPLLANPWLAEKVQPPPFARISPTAWAALAIGGLACTATTTFLWNWGIHHVPASRAGVFLNIEPALGSILGVKLLGERLGPFAWAGGALILVAAIVLTTRGNEIRPEIVLE